MSASYTYDQLKQIKGQAVKDIWHSFIGKPAGIKNTTGLKNGEEIIQAILEAQRNPEFLKKFTIRPPKHQEQEQQQPKEMPPKQTKPNAEKKKPGPKSKPVVAATPVAPPRSSPTLAYESNEIPIVPTELKRVVVKKLFVDDIMYFVDSKTNKLYADVDGRPGNLCGTWNPQTKQVMTLEA